MHPHPHDLFGEIPVTIPEIDAWIRAVPNLEPGTARAIHYAKAWDVASKIRAAKLAGTFDQIIEEGIERIRLPF